MEYYKEFFEAMTAVLADAAVMYYIPAEIDDGRKYVLDETEKSEGNAENRDDIRETGALSLYGGEDITKNFFVTNLYGEPENGDHSGTAGADKRVVLSEKTYEQADIMHETVNNIYIDAESGGEVYNAAGNEYRYETAEYMSDGDIRMGDVYKQGYIAYGDAAFYGNEENVSRNMTAVYSGEENNVTSIYKNSDVRNADTAAAAVFEKSAENTVGESDGDGTKSKVSNVKNEFTINLGGITQNIAGDAGDVGDALARCIINAINTATEGAF